MVTTEPNMCGVDGDQPSSSLTIPARVAAGPRRSRTSLGVARDMIRNILIAFVSLIMILIGSLLFGRFGNTVASPKLTVSFLAFTNNSSGASCCAFVLTNSASQSIYRISSYRITSPAGTDTITNAALSYDYADRVLRPGDSEVILIPTPISPKAWRACFDFWTYRGRIRSVAEDFVIATRRALGTKVQDVHHWSTGMSEVITE